MTQIKKTALNLIMIVVAVAATGCQGEKFQRGAKSKPEAAGKTGSVSMGFSDTSVG